MAHTKKTNENTAITQKQKQTTKFGSFTSDNCSARVFNAQSSVMLSSSSGSRISNTVVVEIFPPGLSKSFKLGAR